MTTLAQNATFEQTTENQLIDVFAGIIGGIKTQLCKATDLHAFLDVGTKFADWIRGRIEKYGFVENQDFILVSENTEIKNGRGGDRRSKEYHLTLDTAKELAMVENNDKGRQVRRYFIGMEKQAIAALMQQQAQQPLLISRQAITPEQKAALHEIVANRAGNNRKVFAQMWSRHNKHFRIAKYEELLAIHFDDAVAYLETMELTTPKASTEALPDFLGTREAMKELTQTMGQYMDSLRVMMQGAGCAMPQFPLIDTERYAQGVMLQLLMSQNFSLSFNHDMQLQLTALPKATLSVDPTDSRSIRNLVPRIPTAQLAEVAQAMIAEMGKRTSRLLA